MGTATIVILDDELVWTWLALCALSTAYVAWDNFGRGK